MDNRQNNRRPRAARRPPEKRVPPNRRRGDNRRSTARSRRPSAAIPPSRKRPRAKRRSIPITVLASLIFLVVMAYMVNAAVRLGNRADVPSVAVQMGSLDVPVVLDGIIVRNERVYTAPISGAVNYNYNEFDRVKKGATVCGIYNEEAIESIAGDIDEINNAILRLQDRRSEITAFKKDVENIHSQVKTIVDNKLPGSIQADFTAVFEIKQSISQNLKLRNQILLNESRGSLSALASDRQHYENELSKNFTNIYAEESGVISYVIDGMEDRLNFERLNNILAEETRMTVDYDNLLRGRNVEQGDGVFKMLLSNEWYLAAYIPMEQVYEWKEGETRTVYIQRRGEYSAIEMRVDSLVKGEKEYYVLFKTTKNIIDYMDMRTVKFKITNSELKGYKIPASAIAERTLLKVPSEYLVSGSGFSVIRHTELADEKIPVNVQEDNGEYAYITQEINNLVLNDSIKLPVEPYTVHQVSEVVNVKGVYVINRGYAEFKKITLDPHMPVTGEYVILNTEENKTIRIHDRIISEAKSVAAEQKVVQ